MAFCSIEAVIQSPSWRRKKTSTNFQHFTLLKDFASVEGWVKSIIPTRGWENFGTDRSWAGVTKLQMQKSWTAQRPHLEYPFEIFGISPRNTKGARCSSKYFLSISNLEKRWNPFLYAKRCCSLEYFCINLDFGWILLMQRHIAVHEADEAEWKFIVIFLKKQRQSKSLGAHSSNQED